MPSRFARDTAVDPNGDGRYTGTVDPGWWVVRGPNGGYIAALVLRAMIAEVDDPARTPRSLTVHYTRPPEPGPVDIDVAVERSGRGLTTVSARMTQGDVLLAVALGALGALRPGPSFADGAPPSVPSPDALSPVDRGGPPIAIRDRYETRPAVTASDAAEVGGWIRLADPEPIDHCVVAALTDAWYPAVFDRFESPAAVPTIDLTVHFRNPPPARHEWSLVRFRSTEATDGYVEEDGEVWSADGVLVAQSRQLAAILPMP